MFEVDHTAASSLPFKTKRTLQALLKTREQLSSRKINDFQNHVQSVPKNFQISQNQFCVLNSDSPAVSSFPHGIEDYEDPNQDFTYSQKLFHIDDGNLYSIFSPIQGRSYGMKPSFLRKQKCTVQECHGKSRKVLKKGLKFHNFLPSEVVTSEKDNNNYLEDEWQVHSECKLREEHGTKQIMVSNWFQNIKQSNDSNSGISHAEELTPATSSPQVNSDPFKGPRKTHRKQKRLSGSKSSNSENTSTSTKDLNNSPTSSSVPHVICEKPDEISYLDSYNNYQNVTSQLVKNTKSGSFLNNLLFSIDKTNSRNKPYSSRTSEPNDSKCNASEVNSSFKSRRKPNQTRRVVPYTKYLSILEETESSPLDLSCNSRLSNSTKRDKDDIEVILQQPNVQMQPQSLNTLVQSKSQQRSDANRCFSRMHKYVQELPQSSTSTLTVPPYMYPVTTNAPSCVPPNVILLNSPINSQNPQVFQHKLNVPSKRNLINPPPPPYHNNIHLKADIKHEAFSKPRKKSQRAVIKQKLEDTFRQNGFLVKTKQVSDGEATFCKFRQLRKYTRYYLKSWQHHLPDEVHKMWKGFLPPKTVLPPVSEAHSQCNDEQIPALKKILEQ